MMIAPPRRGTPAVAPAAADLPTLAASDTPVTQHALLVLLGHFAQHLGLVTRLQAVPVPQKTVDHAPQTKLIEFLVAILAGVPYLQELNHAPAPLAADPTVAQAWGQPAFAHYSGVSRTLAAADPRTLHAVLDALAEVSRPFIDREVLALLQTGQSLTVDIDLTGRPVSPTSTDYPDAAFGWMDDAVAKGYQSAMSSLSGGPSGRLLLTSQRYAGQAKSADCLQAAVAAVEARLGVRPLRRTGLLQAECDRRCEHLEVQRQHLAAAQDTLETAQWKLERHTQEQQRRDERFLRQQERLQRRAERSRATVARLRHHVALLDQQQRQQHDRLAQFRAENAALTAPVPVVIRLDAGFATEANLTWLIELGYTVLTKVHSGHTTKRLQRGVDPAAIWTPVGANADALALGPHRIGDGCYALEALQVRYTLPEGHRYTTLVWYGDTPAPAPKDWFAQYNGRQTLEAGIKENKAVFTMRRPLVRSPIGMQLQEAFALFAANFVRWAMAWVQSQVRELPAALSQTVRQVKTLVRVLAHSRAQLVRSETGCALVFDAHSPFAGAALVICGHPVYQAVLPLFSDRATAPQEVT